MSYIKALIDLKNKDKKILLGQAWTKRTAFNDDNNVPDCGCALAELVPGIVDEIRQQSKERGVGINCHFRTYFTVFNADGRLFNGMTRDEAQELEYYNDSCTSSATTPVCNTQEECEQRYKLVDKWLTKAVDRELQYITDQELSLNEMVNKAK